MFSNQKIFPFLCLILLCVPSLSTLNCSIPYQQYSSLNNFFVSTSGGNWLWNHSLPQSTKWVFPSSLFTPCSNSWQGLTCSLVKLHECSIVKLILPSSNLNGKLPPSIGNLTGLNSLDLGLNHLTGNQIIVCILN